jgi:REP element-mobilizing transposase RayT
MILNTSGKIIKKWWLELLNKFTNIYLDEFTIMPNHFHSIIIINKNSKENIESINNTTDNKKDNAKIADIIKWFKTMTTNEYIRRIKSGEFKPFDKHLWQRNYYEHIIKNKKSYLYIINYIKNNPQNWHKDKFFTP